MSGFRRRIVWRLARRHGSEEPGSVYLFTRSATGWDESAKLMPSDGAPLDEFGHVVALAGESIAVGSLYADNGGFGSGAVYLFDRAGEGWAEVAKLTPPNATAFSFSNSLAAVEGTILVGTHEDSRGDDLAGSAYLFDKTSGVWVESATLTSSDGAEDDVFGYVVAMENGTAVVSAQGDDDKGSRSGSAYVFDLSDPKPAARPPSVEADFEFGHTFPSGVVTLIGRWSSRGTAWG